MKKTENDFAKYLSKFLTGHLPGVLNVSKHTVKSYRDAFKLFLLFLEEKKNVQAERIRLSNITYDLVLEFLDWIETDRNCSTSTRNQRLAALHSFFRYVQKESPENLYELQRIIGIPSKKHPRKCLQFLTLKETEILLAQPDTSTAKGKRNLVILSLMYDSGARVQELVDLTVKDIRLDDPAVVILYGKGGLSRSVPIMKNTTLMLKEYISNYDKGRWCSLNDRPLFYNQQRSKLTRKGISYILNKYAESAREHPEFQRQTRITPHVLRHSRAAHMLQAGIPLIYIRDFLGHVSVTSTEIYARLNDEIKRKAINEAYVELEIQEFPSWQKDNNLMSWLTELCK